MKRYLLAIDGGGVRNAFSMRFMQMLFEHYPVQFDMIGGISAGALTGALIAYGKQDLFETILATDLYSEFFDPDAITVPYIRCKYNGKRKREFIDRYLGNIDMNAARTPFLTATYNWSLKKPQVFYSNEEQSVQHSLVDVLNASTAACTYFPPVTLNDCIHVDSGVVMNNPSLLVYASAYRKWPQDELYMLSLGCGRSPAQTSDFKFINYSTADWALHGILDLLESGPNQVYENLAETLCDNYLRIDIPLEIPLDAQNAQCELMCEAVTTYRNNEPRLEILFKEIQKNDNGRL